MEEINSTADYYDRVNSIVDSIENEYNDYPGEGLSNMVFESVDSSHMIIYTSYHLDILQHSNYEPTEWKHLVVENGGYQAVIQAMAFDVLRSDIWAEVRDRDIE